MDRPSSVLVYRDSERQPIARACAEASLGPSRPPAPVDGLVLGYAYECILADGTPAPAVANPIGDYVPTARPGHRAPHLWLTVDGARRSTLDLFGDGFVVLHDARSDASVGASDGVPLRCQAIDDPAWCDLYGVRPGGAVLVRPDGHVAWRSPDRPLEWDAAVLGRVIGTQAR